MLFESNLYNSYEVYKLQNSNKQYILPVTLITGFLGSGKTTLVKHALRNKMNLKIASIVNDYGEIDHDGGVIEKAGLDKECVKLTGDCMCCCKNLSDGMRDSVWEMLQASNSEEPEVHDQMDYLIMETSGVTDPTQIIEMLEMRFGKLTRARLDAVVTVVDMDHLLADLDAGRPSSAVAEKQLLSADIVVLNKEDLVTAEQKEIALKYVQSLNPEAQVHTCSYGQLPLHCFMDLCVTPAQASEAVSHEKGDQPRLHASPTGGKFRKTLSKTSLDPTSSDTTQGSLEADSIGAANLTNALGHLEVDNLNSVTFQSKRFFNLAKFQDFIALHLPEGLVRMKGVLTFQEESTKRVVFNLSGRRRLGFEMDGVWTCPASSYLVLVGRGINEQEILSQLEGLLSAAVAEESLSEEVQEECEQVKALLRADLRFDVLDPACTSAQLANNAIYFRLTAARAMKMSVDQLHLRYGLNFNAMNHLCMNLVNSHGILLSCTEIDEETQGTPQLWLRFALGGEQSFQHMWNILEECSTETMRQHTGHLNLACNCSC